MFGPAPRQGHFRHFEQGTVSIAIVHCRAQEMADTGTEKPKDPPTDDGPSPLPPGSGIIPKEPPKVVPSTSGLAAEIAQQVLSALEKQQASSSKGESAETPHLHPGGM